MKPTLQEMHTRNLLAQELATRAQFSSLRWDVVATSTMAGAYFRLAAPLLQHVRTYIEVNHGDLVWGAAFDKRCTTWAVWLLTDAQTACLVAQRALNWAEKQYAARPTR